MVTRNVDVVVIGSGVAGLSAAVEAAARGAKVLVLEGASRIGGASAMSGAGCCIVGTPEQAEIGVEDNVELALADWAAFGGPTADLDWARDYLANSFMDVYQWCAETGITWGAPILKEGNSVPRWHPAEQYGIGVIGGLLERLRRFDVPIVTDAPVEELLVEGGTVVGVRVAAVSGVDEVRAKAVIVATGGFVNNRDLLNRMSPRLRDLPRYLLGGSPTACGSGHRLLESVDAQFVSMENVWVYPNGTPDPRDPSGNRGLGLRNVVTELWLNSDGDRFHDESLSGGQSGTRAVLAQPGKNAWAVFDGAEAETILLIDNEYYAAPSGPQPRAMSAFWQESEDAARADSIVELAQVTGLPEGALRDSIARFNQALADGLGTDPDTGRPLAGLSPVGTHGFAAIHMYPMAQKNFGGIRTDLTCRVLNRSGSPIPGAYAAGEAAGMAGGTINGVAGLEGTMFGPCLYSGRRAGKSVMF